MSLAQLVGSVEESLDTGNVDAAVRRRTELVQLCAYGSSEDLDLVRGRVLAAELSLVMVERQQVAGLLREWVREGTEPEPIWEAIHRLDDEPELAALVASAGGDLLFRQRRYEWAYRLTRFAQDQFDRTVGIRTAPRTPVGRLWNLARLARISWRTSSRGGLADQLLHRCLGDLERAAPDLKPGRRDSIEAFCLDIWASLDWARGLLDDARRKIYRALFLHRRGTLKDSSRAAHALFIAGKVEASLATRDNFRVAIELLEEAEALFPKGNALAPQATIQRAEAIIKAGEVKTGAEILERLEPLTDPVHRAEAALARAWISVRERDWVGAEQWARKLLEQGEQIELPRRLLADGYLQLGCALVGRGDAKRGIRELRRALDLARKHGRVKIEIAARLELTSAYNGDGKDQLANDYLREATELLSRVRSGYLEERRDAIARELHHGWVFVVETDHWDDEKHKFGVRFFTRLLHQTNYNVALAARRAGVARGVITRILQETPDRRAEGSIQTRRAKRRSRQRRLPGRKPRR